MGNPISKRELAAGFEQLIYREDHIGFFKALSRVDPSFDIWASLQIRSVDLLVQQGAGMKAATRARTLKNSLTNPVLRKQAEIKYLYLKQVVNLDQDSKKLEEECLITLANPDFKELRLFVQGILLRLAATKLMCGLTDADGKKPLIKRYIEHIRACERNQHSEEAFEFLKELIQFLLSRPLPMPEKALGYLHYYRRLSFTTTRPHRLAHIDLQIAELRLEHHLTGAPNKDHEKYYLLAARSFKQAKHPLGKAYIQKSQGQTLLKYGKPKGRRLLYEASRSFETKCHLVQSLNIHSAIIQWLETSGVQSTLSSYHIRLNTLREELQLFAKTSQPVVKVSQEGIGNSVLVNIRKVVALTGQQTGPGSDKELRLVKALVRKIEKKGKTIHLARALACETEMSGNSTTSQPSAHNDHVIALFIELGYPLEAVELMTKDLLALGSLPQNRALSTGFPALLESDMEKIEVILRDCHDIESREALAKSYQVVAYLWTSLGFSEKGITLLKRSCAILKTHKLLATLALNELYLGCTLLEACGNDQNNGLCLQANDHFAEAYQLFKLMNNHEGIWRSQFGRALSTHKRIAQDSQPPTLLVQDCSENYLRAIEAVHYLTTHHLKTLSRFGESFVFSTRIQKGADQLYASAIDYCVNIVCDPATTRSLLDKKRAWVLLNRPYPKVKMN